MDKKILSKSNLQLIAAAAMLIDHISFLAPNYYILLAAHTISRITIVIMCWFIAEGFYKTHDLSRYILRMGMFAAISQIPYYLFSLGAVPANTYSFLSGCYSNRNVIFTLFVGLCLLTVVKSKLRHRWKLIALVCALFTTRNSDWGLLGVLSIVIFAWFRGDFKRQAYSFVTVLFIHFIVRHIGLTVSFAQTDTVDVIQLLNSLTYAGCLLALPLLRLYNGKRGSCPKYALYIFYPAHLLLLYFVKLIVF